MPLRPLRPAWALDMCELMAARIAAFTPRIVRGVIMYLPSQALSIFPLQRFLLLQWQRNALQAMSV